MWSSVKDSRKISDLQNFRQAVPDGLFAEIAAARMENLIRMDVETRELIFWKMKTCLTAPCFSLKYGTLSWLIQIRRPSMQTFAGPATRVVIFFRAQEVAVSLNLRSLLIAFWGDFLLGFSPFLQGQFFAAFHLEQNALQPLKAEFQERDLIPLNCFKGLIVNLVTV